MQLRGSQIIEDLVMKINTTFWYLNVLHTAIPWCYRGTRMTAVLGREGELQVSNMVFNANTELCLDIELHLGFSEDVECGTDREYSERK